MKKIDTSYAMRREMYRRWRKGEDVSKLGYHPLIMQGTNDDYTLSTNDVSDILGFSVEHVQNYVLEKLDVVDATEEMRMYIGNGRLKRIISKSSLEEYITESLVVTERRTVTNFAKTHDDIKKIKELLGPRCKMQKLFDDVGKYLDNKYNPDKLAKDDKERMEKMKNLAEEQGTNILHYLETGSLDVSEVLDYYDSKANKYTEIQGDIGLIDVLVGSMHSIKKLKTMLNKKHTMQVYRFLEKTSYIAVKLGDKDFVSSNTNGNLSDRNIRYIVSAKDLIIPKNTYRLAVDNYTYEKMYSISAVIDIELEYILLQEAYNFAKLHKEKYKKEKK